MSSNRHSEFVDIHQIGKPDATYPNPGCHIIPVVFDETGEAWVQVNSVSFREGKLKVTSGGALEANETILEAGLREAQEESPALPITAGMITPYAWQYAHPKYVTFSLAAIVTNQYYSLEKRNDVLAAHNAADKLAKDLLDMAFLPEDKVSKEIQPNNLAGFGSNLKELIQLADKQPLPVSYLQQCLEKLAVFQLAQNGDDKEAINKSKKDLLETIRIKTEFVGRNFVKLSDIQAACKTVLEIDQQEKSIDARYKEQLAEADAATKITINAAIKSEKETRLPKKPEFQITSTVSGMNGKYCKLFGAGVESIAPLIFSDTFMNDVKKISHSIQLIQPQTPYNASNVNATFQPAARKGQRPSNRNPRHNNIRINSDCNWYPKIKVSNGTFIFIEELHYATKRFHTIH